MDVDQYRRELKGYSSEIELAHYEYRAGLTNELRLEPIFDRYGELFSIDAITALRNSKCDIPSDKDIKLKAHNALLALAQIGYLDAQATHLTNELARCEAAARIKWDENEVPAHGASKLLANEPSATRRRDLYSRWMDAIQHCDDLRAARIESLHKSAITVGASSYSSLYSELTGTDFRDLSRKVESFLNLTDRSYRRELRRFVSKGLPNVQFDELEHCDYFFLQRMSNVDSYFAADGVISTYEAAMAGLGIKVSQQKNVYIDDQPRLHKHPRAACFRINPPGDVRLIVAPIGGVYDYTTLFHEAGHAQHFAWTSLDLASNNPEFVYSPDYATTEGYAFLLNHLLHDADWLVEYRPAIGAEKAREVVRDLAFITSYTVRRFTAKLNYDIVLHDADRIRSESLAAAYAAMQSDVTGFRRSPAFYLSDIDDGFYSAAYLRAWAFEAGLREYLRTKFGRRWWASHKAGDELIDLWNTGSQYSVEELSKLLGLGELSFDLLAESLLAAMNGE